MTDAKKIVIDKLFALERRGIKPGLERTIELLEAVGNPHKSFLSVHIAGTNGKGSVASIIASVLTESGYKVGLYTSPHIKEFNERIRIDGTMISDDELIELAEQLLDKSYFIGATFFEITTALAFWYFSKSGVDVAVLETGLGGQFDSTNVVTPIISVITSIDIDHTDFLGDTIEQIAAEKGGIIKQGVPCVIGESKKIPQEVLIKKAVLMSSEYYLPNSGEATLIRYFPNLSMEIELQSYFRSYDVVTPLVGEHQLSNHLTAVNALERIRRRFPFTDENLKAGIRNIKQNTGLQNRIELVKADPPTIIDVAHNPAAIKKLKATIKAVYPDTKFNIVFGAMSDKDISGMLLELKSVCNELILTAPSTPRACSIVNLTAIAEALHFKKVNSLLYPNQAFQYGLSLNEPLLAVGSFYLIGEIED